MDLPAKFAARGVSVASNIAEGYGRSSTGDYKRFPRIACGSNLKVQAQLVIRHLGIGDPHEFGIVEGFSEEIGKMLIALMRSL
jgi:four helix bundle protein